MNNLDDREVLTVRQVNERISDAVAAAFPRTLRVRGEIQRFPRDAPRRQHLYFELHETGTTGAAEYQIPVALMGWDRERFGLARFLDGTDPDLQLADKLEVCFECRVDYYAKFGKLSLKIVGVDKTFSLGRLEARRREILAFLAARGLRERNRGVPLPDLPLRIGLITAPGSAAERDFTTGLEQSPWPFVVTLAPARMQGERVQAEVLAGLRTLLDAGVDVVVITRGGGSRADLSWFDQQDLAVAIAECPVPVVTAIGHEIDRSIADDVAHRSCKTPTAAAEFLVDRVDTAAARLAEAAGRLAVVAARMLEDAARRVDLRARLRAAADRRLLDARMTVQRQGVRLQQGTGTRLVAARHRLAGRAGRLGTAAVSRVAAGRERTARLQPRLLACSRSVVDQARRAHAHQAGRLARESARALAGQGRRLDALAVQSRLLDPARLLERGYSITLGPDGRSLTRADQVSAGDRITTRLAAGRLASIVQPGAGGGAARRKARKRGGNEEDPGQETLFR